MYIGTRYSNRPENDSCDWSPSPRIGMIIFYSVGFFLFIPYTYSPTSLSIYIKRTYPYYILYYNNNIPTGSNIILFRVWKFSRRRLVRRTVSPGVRGSTKRPTRTMTTDRFNFERYTRVL